MEKEKLEIESEQTKVKELIQLLKANEKYLELLGGHEKLLACLRSLRIALKPYKKSGYQRIIELLKRPPLWQGKDASRKTILTEVEIEQLSLEKLKTLATDEKTSKEELLLLAEKRLGIPTGTLKKMKKELVKQRILITIQNIGKFEAIGKKSN